MCPFQLPNHRLLPRRGSQNSPAHFFDNMPMFLDAIARGWRVGFFNFGSGQDRVLEKWLSQSGLRILNQSGIIGCCNSWLCSMWVFSFLVIFNSWSTWLDITFWISRRAYRLFTIYAYICIYTFIQSLFSPNQWQKVCKSQWQQIATNVRKSWKFK